MTTRRPPALAAWLLDHFGYTAVNPALIGDLNEEFQRGRSSRWYWRQTLVILATFPRRMGMLPALYVAALLTGFALELPAGHALWRLALHYGKNSKFTVLDWIVIAASLAVIGACEAYFVPDRRKRAIANQTGVFRDAIAVVAARSLITFTIFVIADGDWLRTHDWSSFGDLAISHVVWIFEIALLLLPFELTPTRSGLLSKPDPAVDRLPSHDLALPVQLRRSRTIVLKPESLPGILFNCEDIVLIRILRKAPSLAVIRRAIWLGSARNYQADLMGELPVLTLSGLTSLIHEATRVENVAAATAIPIPGEVDGVRKELVGVLV